MCLLVAKNGLQIERNLWNTIMKTVLCDFSRQSFLYLIRKCRTVTEIVDSFLLKIAYIDFKCI